MDIASEIAQAAGAIASNVQQIVAGTGRVEKYRAQIEELFALDNEITNSISPAWDSYSAGLRTYLEMGKQDWHGEKRDKIDNILDDDYHNAMRRFYRDYIAHNWEAIQNKINYLQGLIDQEEGLIAKLTAENEEIKSRQTQLEKSLNDEETKAQQKRLNDAIAKHPEYLD